MNQYNDYVYVCLSVCVSVCLSVCVGGGGTRIMISGSGVERGGEQSRERAEQRGRMAERAGAEMADGRDGRAEMVEQRRQRQRESREPRLGARVGRRGGTG